MTNFVYLSIHLSILLGVGRWIDIRQDFMLNRNSAQMNQRFARLAKLREMHLLAVNSNTKNKSSSAVPTSTHSRYLLIYEFINLLIYLIYLSNI